MGAEVKKVIIAVAVLATAVAVLRRFGPTLRQEAMRKCEEMFAQMPDDFPPKRMMRGIDEIRKQNVVILRRLQEQAKVQLAVATD